MQYYLSISIFLLMSHLGLTQTVVETANQCKPTVSFENAITINPADSSSKSDTLNFRSCRPTYFYVDGVKVLLNKVPENTEQIHIITGGLPVNYGDLNSSLIRISSKTNVKMKLEMRIQGFIR